MIKILIGGSPCTHWSIAQKNNRETEPQGIGWELFKNYLIAKEKFKPDFFLYENNKSAAQPIKDQISKELGVSLQYINSALVSAQNRQRFYAHNIPDVPQPVDRGILLKDILESGTDLSQNEKSFCMAASYNGACSWNTLERSQKTMVAESVCVAQRGRYESTESRSVKVGSDKIIQVYEAREDGKTNTLTTVQKDNMIAEPVRVGEWDNGSQGNRLYSIDGKTPAIRASGAEHIIEPVEFENGIPLNAISLADGKTYPVYEVKDGLITIKGKQYKIKLADGFYIIRKLTVTECCRLQTMPDDYCRAVSASQGYKGLGNGWTAEVIIHILKHMNISLDEEIIVLSMYDGIGTGRYCFDKMGYKNIKYYAYEIDKYAMQIAMSNYTDIIQCGDAFQVREDNWSIEKATTEQQLDCGNKK